MPTINDNLKKYKSLFSTTLSTGIGTGTGDTITPSSVSGLPTDTAITLTFDRVDASGTATPTKLERIKGIISGGNFTAYVRAIDGTTEQAHTAGAVIEMVWNADDWNNSVDAFLTQHTQSGTHGAITAPSAAIVGNVTASAINVGASTAITGVLDEDTMSSNSAVKLATQQSIKAYVDANGSPVDGWAPATGSWTYASADAPTFVITVPSGAASIYNVGDRIKLTQTTIKYFIVTAITDTTLTVYGGTDYTLVDATISLNYYSHQKAPLGFPLNPDKWTQKYNEVGTLQSTPTSGTWYNLGGSLSIPIGVWIATYETSVFSRENGSNTLADVWTTLSTANNSQSDIDWSCNMFWRGATTNIILGDTVKKEKIITLTSKATYYLNAKVATTGVDNLGLTDINTNTTRAIIRAVCAFL